MRDNPIQSVMKTIEEFKVEGKAGNVWQACGYRETFDEAMSYMAELQTGTAGDVYDNFRIKPEMVKWEESEKFLRLHGN